MFSKSSLALVLGLGASASLAGPCDIYASGNTPCIAAHSTTRALYNSFSGALYQVRRGSDNATSNITPLSAGGVANAGAQDSFCASTTCLITIIYDQSGYGNHLTQAPPGGAAAGPNPGGLDDLASAIGAPVTLNGKKAYGVFIHPAAGYRNNAAKRTATGDAAEGLYAVFDGTHYNGQCCFDYGNAETSSTDTGNGHMESLYFGTGTGYGTGAGSGPWILADLENGLYNQGNAGVNPNQPSQTSRFVTGALKGEPGNQWSIRGNPSNAQSLVTYYSGVRPTPGYNPMSKEGAIILGIGGDNSNWAQGTFYEGVMTTGYPSDKVENSVQANVAAQNYATTPLSSAPLTVGSSISLRVTTPNYNTRYLAHTGSDVNTQVVTSSSPAALKGQASWIVRASLSPGKDCYSFESKDTPGSFLRHSNYVLVLNANDGSKLFSEDATFCSQTGLNGQGDSIRSWSYPTRYFRHYAAQLYIGQNGGFKPFDAPASYNDDVTWAIGSSFA